MKQRKVGVGRTGPLRRHLLVSFTGLLLTAGPAFAASTIYVDADNGDDGNNGESPGAGGAVATIQKGIDLVDPGGTVYVAPGTYNEDVLIEDKDGVQILGPTAGIDKSGYTIPPNYAWDDSVEAILNPGTLSGNVFTITDCNDIVFDGFVVQALGRETAGGGTDMLVTTHSDHQDCDNIQILNNVIGPNTNTATQDGTKGRMNLYIDVNSYVEGGYGLTNSLIAGNQIFGAEGNGNGVFIWGAYYTYHPLSDSDMTGTVFENNAIHSNRRSGLELAGKVRNLTFRSNKIYNNSSENGGPSDPKLKYGNGVVIIRGSSDRPAGSNAFGADNYRFYNNEIYGNEKNGIYLGPVNTRYLFSGNNIYDNGQDGLRLDINSAYHGDNNGPYDTTKALLFKNNTFAGNDRGVALVGGTPTNSDFGVHLVLNTFTNNTTAAIVLDGPHALIGHNTFANNTDIIVTVNAGKSNVVYNMFDATGTAVNNTDTSNTLNAVSNWWGDASGPSGAVTDACDGVTVANGSGGAIVGDVCFAPFLGTMAAATANLDADLDGYLLAQEDQNGNGFQDPDESNPGKKDTDGDGVEDFIESLLGTDPLSPDVFTDTDGDSIPFGIDPNDMMADTDEDNISDGYELAVGTDPDDSDSKPDLGDLNGDGAVGFDDGLATLQYFLGLISRRDSYDWENADVNRDSNVDNVDGVTIVNLFLDNIESIPVPVPIH